MVFSDAAPLTGEAAEDEADVNPKNTVFDINRLLGRKYDDAELQEEMKRFPFKVIEKAGKPQIEVDIRGQTALFTPEEVSAMILAKMKESAESYLGTTVTDAVIAVPAHFDNSHCQAIKDAGRIAGLNVLKTINEPSAVAVAHSLDKVPAGERRVLVLDYGGSNSSVSAMNIEEGILDTKSTVGNAHLGGKDLDTRLAEYCGREFQDKHQRVGHIADFCHEGDESLTCICKDLSSDAHALRRLRAACERAKHTLSSSENASIEIDSLFDDIDFSTSITRARFEQLCGDLLSPVTNLFRRILSESGMDRRDVDDVILSGGSSRIPLIQELVPALFNIEPKISINPDEDVACGAAVKASILSSGNGAEVDIELGDEDGGGMPGGDSGGSRHAGGAGGHKSVTIEDAD